MGGKKGVNRLIKEGQIKSSKWFCFVLENTVLSFHTTSGVILLNSCDRKTAIFDRNSAIFDHAMAHFVICGSFAKQCDGYL